MTAVSPIATLAELVTQRPGRSAVFERYGIDYCCGGRRPLAEACAAHGVDAQEVIAALEAADAADAGRPAEAERDWSRAPLGELIDHIVGVHHAYLAGTLPRVAELMQKVHEAHGARHPELAECREVLAGLRAELELHMQKEERMLFPAIRGLAEGGRPGRVPFDSVQQPIRVMEHEHDSAGAALARLRELTGQYAVPENACSTWRALLDVLPRLEEDLHVHIHEENNILFPRAIELEGAGAAGSRARGA